ncbi:MAG: hypothetical protein JXA82_10925 [Sedimentisphaerales bacterium]|nr:hypothetical protein [Sedimentisphaerales bacterium]
MTGRRIILLSRRWIINLIVLVCICFLILVVIVYLGIKGWCKEITYESMIGTYEGRYVDIFGYSTPGDSRLFNGGIHTLVLKSDGSYTYMFSPTKGDRLTSEDIWEFDEDDKRHHIGLHCFDPESRFHDREWWWSTVIIKFPFGRLGIPIGDDQGFFLLKNLV